MGQRKWDEPHRDTLVRLVAKLQEQMDDNLRFWLKMDEKVARHRHAVIGSVFRNLVDAAREAGVPRQDLGLTDWEYPAFEEFVASRMIR